MAITFDRINKIILIGAPTTDITVQDLYNAISDYQDNQENMDLPQIASASGKEFLGGGVYVGITVKLLDSWRVQFEPRLSETICNVNGGNLLSVDINGDPVFPLAYSTFVMATLTSSSSATLQELTNIQYSSFDGGITIDEINGTDSSIFPYGTPAAPVKTLLNAREIAIERGFKNIYVIGDLSIVGVPPGILVNYNFVGQGHHTSTMTVTDVQMIGCTFTETELTGTFSNGSSIATHDCELNNVSNITLDAYDCELIGTITLNDSTPSNFNNCIDGVPGSGSPVINVDDCESLGIWGYNGGIALTNIINNTAISVNFSSGRLILDDTCTNGSIIVRGVGSLFDGSNGTSVSATALLDIPTIANGVSTTTIDDDIDVQKALKVLVSVIAGKANGGNTSTVNFRDRANVANVVTMTVDIDGNRSDVVIN